MPTKKVLIDGKTYIVPKDATLDQIEVYVRSQGATPPERSLLQRMKENFNSNTQHDPEPTSVTGMLNPAHLVREFGAGAGDAVRGAYHMFDKPGADPYAGMTPEQRLQAIADDTVESGRKQTEHFVHDPAGAYAAAIGEQAPALIAGAAGEEIVGGLRRGTPKAVETVKSGRAAAKAKFKAASEKVYPRNVSLTPQEAATQGLIKGSVPELAAVQRIKGATSELPDALAHAERKGMKINGKLDASKAMRERAEDIQNHYTEKLMRPHSGKFKTVPEEYSGEMSGNGKNQATIGQINDRVDAINRELKSNFRKKLKSQTTEAQASDADLNSEKGKLTKILHESLAEMNGLQPEDIASVRQRAGKLRSLAEETELSADRDTVSSGRSAMGSTGVPAPTKTGMIEHAYQKIKGGPETIGNRNFKAALEKFKAEETPLPEPVLPEPTSTATTPEAAHAEFLHSNELEQAAQDAAAARNAEANKLREQNVNTQRQAAQDEATRAVTSEHAAQDAAASRNIDANKLREQNVDTQRDLAKQEATHAITAEQAAQDAAADRSAVADDVRGNNTATQKGIADQEFLKSNELEQSAQDSSKARFKAATDARAGRDTVPTSAPQPPKQPIPLPAETATPVQPPPTAPTTVIPPSESPVALPAPKAEPPIAAPHIVEKEVVASDAVRGVKPVSIPVIETSPETHVFSKSAAKVAEPGIDVDEAAKAAKAAGYEVHE